MKAIMVFLGLAMIGLGCIAQAVAGDFTYYASPKLAYQCTGYNTAWCNGFESSDAAHAVTLVGMRATSANPLQFQVTISVDGTPYKAYNVDGNNTNVAFPATDTIGSGTQIMVTVAFVKTVHCVNGKCQNRYLAEAGSVSAP